MSNSTPNWTLLVAGPAGKSLGRLPDRDQRRIEQALDGLGADPYSGDVKRLQPSGWRRRVGSYRIFYDIFPDEKRVLVTAIERRTSTTY